tara:strand:+ start:1858 stop:3006 length:1149 start_codon:yes stop_codon:yes gene_type:complete
MANFIPYYIPSISEEEINEVNDTLRSGWLTTGNKTKKFETNFSNFLDNSVESIAVSSATAGLHLALVALGVGKGDEVIVPNHTFTATAEVVRYTNAEVKLVDININSLNIDPKLIEKSINPKTKAIIVVHFSGLACEMNEIIKIAKKYKLFVIEDAAHALPTTYMKNTIGKLNTDATIFSFYANKTITTGEGGMLVTKNKELAKKIKILRIHGIDTDVFDRFVSTKPKWFYQVVDAGFKYNLSDIASSIGLHQLKKVNQFQIKRQQIADYYFNELSKLDIELPAKPNEGDLHSWHLFIIKLNCKNESIRNKFIEKMYEMGIGCSVHYIPLNHHIYWKERYPEDCSNMKISDSIYNRIVSLPIYSSLSEDNLEQIIKSIKKLI